MILGEFRGSEGSFMRFMPEENSPHCDQPNAGHGQSPQLADGGRDIVLPVQNCPMVMD